MENNKEPIFSHLWFKKKAMEILGNDKIVIKLESPGKIRVTVKCSDNKRLSLFKNLVQENSPLGAKVTICKQ